MFISNTSRFLEIVSKLARHSKQDAKNLTLAELKRLYSMMQQMASGKSDEDKAGMFTKG